VSLSLSFLFLNFPFLFDLPKKQIGGNAGGKSRGTRYPQHEARGPVGARESACEGCGVVGESNLLFVLLTIQPPRQGGATSRACAVCPPRQVRREGKIAQGRESHAVQRHEPHAAQRHGTRCPFLLFFWT
jgi:hypothetical protein